jgi:hypothetical protein
MRSEDTAGRVAMYTSVGPADSEVVVTSRLSRKQQTRAQPSFIMTVRDEEAIHMAKAKYNGFGKREDWS